jgi:hypothetical protein
MPQKIAVIKGVVFNEASTDKLADVRAKPSHQTLYHFRGAVPSSVK